MGHRDRVEVDWQERDQGSVALSDNYDSLLNRLREQGVELVWVVGPCDKDGPCLDWVGAVLSVSGKTPGVPTLGQAVGDGLLHPGCRHTLVAFNPRSASPRRLAEARDRTRHAAAAMVARSRGEEPPYLEARRSLREEAARRAAPGGITARMKFERVYEAARKADAAGDIPAALLKTRAALELLREHNLFGPAQARLVATIQEHLMRLESLRKSA